jgi:uncharacterized 2Fe-2S/4Fe-4S cluster protein (DUF4445 family)
MELRIHSAEGRILEIPRGRNATLAQAIWLSGPLRPPALCSGLGRCGRCRVRFLSPSPSLAEEEKAILTREEIAGNIRLACRHAPLPGMEVRLFPAPEPKRTLHAEYASKPLLLAVDAGTTVLQWRALTPEGETAGEGTELNPQMGAGGEIMSRLALAATREGRELLSDLLRAALSDIVRSLPGQVGEICLAANSATTAIFLKKNTATLAAAPYSLPYRGGRREMLPDLPPLWIPPQISPFVGGDISAGMSFLLSRGNADYPFLLADLGTNGEFVLAADQRRSLVAGVPLGPALEGIGLRCGGIAEDGAVRAFSLTPLGLAPSVLGGGKARSICATGYLSLLGILLRNGLLTPQGVFQSAASTPLARRLAGNIKRTEEGEPFLSLHGRLLLSARDVEAVLAVKAAFSLTLERLLAHAGLRSDEIRRIFVAGALGEHVRADDLETLGFFPPGSAARFTILGNSSLSGASLLLLEPRRRREILRWARSCSAPDVNGEKEFHAAYLEHMRFPH